MKTISSLLKIIIAVIAWFVFASGIVLTGIGIYDFVISLFYLLNGAEHASTLIAINLLRAVDIFLVAIVFFVMALGFFILFDDHDTHLTVKLPEWLRVKNFTQLKIILWEAILTTLVVTWLVSLVEKKVSGAAFDIQSLIIPGGILIIAVSLFFLKKGEADH
jgi:uncharacterized membrane protein YqhA